MNSCPHTPLFIIRHARIEDAKSIADVHIKSWQQTYKGLLPDNYLAAMNNTRKRREEMWTRICVADDKYGLYVALNSDQQVVGFSCAEKARDTSMDGHGELGAIYLLDEYQGKKMGLALFNEAMKWLKNQGYSKAYCWIIAGNPTSSFYKKTGARLLEKTKEQKILDTPVKELCFEWNAIGF